MLDCDITSDQVQIAIKQLKSGKAAGIDQVISELLIYGSHILILYLVDIFNHVFSSGVYPTEWTKGKLQLIYKRGDTNNPNNYRDITLLSNLGKLFDNILYNRIVEWEQNNQLLTEEQAGFRSGYATADHVFVLQSLISKSFCSGKMLYCGMIDFQKAFNSAYRQGLWLKAIQFGMDGRMLKLIRNMYEQVKCCVKGEKWSNRVLFNTARSTTRSYIITVSVCFLCK